MRAVILTGGMVRDYKSIELKKDDYIICADGGVRHAQELNIVPDILIGDFDSIGKEMPSVKKVKYPSEKDETDTLLAVTYAVENNFDSLYIIGALGGRADHSLANIYTLETARENGVKAVLDDGKNRIWLADKPFRIERTNAYLSLFPIFGDVEGVTLKGMKYPLNDFYMRCDSTVGISNEIKDETGEVLFTKGTLLVMLCKD